MGTVNIKSRWVAKNHWNNKSSVSTGALYIRNITVSVAYVTRDNSPRRLLAQHSVATSLRHWFKWLQHCSNIATLCCAKNRPWESSCVTSPWSTHNDESIENIRGKELALFRQTLSSSCSLAKFSKWRQISLEFNFYSSGSQFNKTSSSVI